MRTGRRTFKGQPISPGIAMGRTRVILPGDIKIAEVVVAPSRVNDEIEALERAVAAALEELRAIRTTAGKKVAGPVAKIFDAQVLIAGDYEFLKQVKEQITSQRRNAGFVYNSLVERTTVPLRMSRDPYMQQMALDIEAVSRKVLSHLQGSGELSQANFQPDTVLVGKMFTPGDVLSYRHRKAVGFLVGEGGRNSHMALIARSLMVPAVVVEDIWTQACDDCPIIIDGNTGVVIAHPTEAEWTEYQKLRKRQGPATILRIKKLSTIPPKTKDGKPFKIAANLELPGPMDEILAEQRFPVGLYRTEFMYLEAGTFPDEEAQYQHYAAIAETFAHSEVILRTFDIGSDKMHPSGQMPHEDNPALGFRGIRPMLAMPEVFKDQLRAMLRASVRKNLKIMLPMVSDLAEFEKARKLLGQVMLELRRDRIPFDENIQLGIMVEVPSAALTADCLAEKVDFMSIGTNDLTQYTLSADRSNGRVADIYSPYHPSVLHLIKLTVDACKKRRKPVSICGEVAGDQLALPLFMGMGVDQLSMSPVKIFDMCRLVKQLDSELVRLLVGSVMSSSSVAAVTRKLQSFRDALEQKQPFR
ncbi:MAG: phosphoenolpyruvate--protein phosphotransferase [Candidatus Zixiibacteriota bacterium]